MSGIVPTRFDCFLERIHGQLMCRDKRRRLLFLVPWLWVAYHWNASAGDVEFARRLAKPRNLKSIAEMKKAWTELLGVVERGADIHTEERR